MWAAAKSPVTDNPCQLNPLSTRRFAGVVAPRAFTTGTSSLALLHLRRHRLALVNDKYGQASDSRLSRIDRLVDFPFNDREGLAGLVGSRRLAPTLHRQRVLSYVFHQRAGVRLPG